MSISKLSKQGGKWLAIYGETQKEFKTMKEAAQWLDDCAEKERKRDGVCGEGKTD